jgi:flagellin-like hook-associated protein FlgL
MTYRVTNSMMQTLLLNDMHNNLNKLLNIQQQLSTERKYNYASDNPNAVTRGMGIETQIDEGIQYRSNLEDAVAWLKFTDTALGNMNDLFQRVRELTIRAGDGSLVNVDYGAIAAELKELKKEMVSYANSTMEGRYLFAGLKTSDIPFALVESGDVLYNGNNYEIFWEFARMQTGQVSLTGRDVFPLDETTNYLKGVELPLDFQWTGRNEILEFKVGWQTVKVRIPEKWQDEIRNGIDDTGDYNRYRDPGEILEGWSLSEIADLINNSTEMGDVSKLLQAKVVTNFDTGVQYLQIKSHTGEPVRLTSWPETDALPRAEGMMTAAFGEADRTAKTDGSLEIRFMDNRTYTVDVKKGDDLAAIVDKLNGLQDGRIWAALKEDDDGNAWIDITARAPGDKFFLEATGGAVELFTPGQGTVTSTLDKDTQKQTAQSTGWDTTAEFKPESSGSIIIRKGSNKYEIEIAKGNDLTAIAAAITTYTKPALHPELDDFNFTASVSADGRIVITCDDSDNEPFTVTGSGGLVPLFADGASVSSGGVKTSGDMYVLETSPIDFAITGEGGLAFEYEGVRYWVPVSGYVNPGNPDDSKANLTAIGTALQTAMTNAGLDASVEVKTKSGDSGDMYWLEVKTSQQIKLFGFASGSTVIGKYATGSETIIDNSDHTHIGFANFMGMETTLSSVELPMSANVGNTVTDPMHLKIISGDRHAEVFINDDAELTLEALAARINGVCGDWFEAVVEVDEPDGTDPFADPLLNNRDNREDATKRLILRTRDGAPFTVLDGLGINGISASNYAEQLGLNTALGVPNMWLNKEPGSDEMIYPSDGEDGPFDENMPAILKVTVGEKIFEVKVCKNNRYTGELVAKAIVDQVNEQYGSKLLAWNESVSQTGDPTQNVFSVYALTGEPLRVTDAGYGDPRFNTYTGGIAAYLGIAAGLTAAGITPSTPMTLEESRSVWNAGGGVMRISTPGHTIDIPIIQGESVKNFADRLRSSAGEWLDVSYTDRNMGSTPTTDPDEVWFTIAAKDGSAVSVLDIQGSAANAIGLDTGLTGTEDLAGNNFPTFDSDDTLTITVNGASHTIDLYDETFVNSNGSVGKPVVDNAEQLVDLINTRFQAVDVKASVIEEKDANGAIISKRIAIWSPKGYDFEVTGTGQVPDAIGFAAGNSQSRTYGDGSPFNQNIAHRTGDNTKKVDFFGVMDNLIDTVTGGNVDGISDVMIGQLDHWMTTLLKDRAIAGALINRYETTTSRYISNNTGYNELYTNTVGIDLAEALTNFQMSSSVYEASLAAIARLMQPTLLDFLK